MVGTSLSFCEVTNIGGGRASAIATIKDEDIGVSVAGRIHHVRFRPRSLSLDEFFK